MATDNSGRPGLAQLSHTLAQLLVGGIDLRLDILFAPREIRTFDVARLDRETGETKYSPSTWMVNGVRNRPMNGPEPRKLGQRIVRDQSGDPTSPTTPPSTDSIRCRWQ